MRRILLVGALGATLILSSAGPTIAEQAPAPTQTTASPLPAGRSYRVTLLTGDLVTVRTKERGCPDVSVTPASRGRVIAKLCGADGHVRVIPADVKRLIGTTLDPGLFDVTVLIKNGYDDARSKEIPLLVGYPNLAAAKRARTSGAVTAGLRAQRELASINAVAGRHAKKAPTALAEMPKGTRIFLDRKVRVMQDKVDVNLRQVSAPQAWQAGYTGKGVRVAVLDTGIDPTHPDLAGKVVEAANFSDDPDTADNHGHGTHVASIVAGSGAASGGERRGVAPDAVLLNGKVLDRFGGGMDSQIIAGMEWAAARADVVNMSLGGWEESDGTDPLSLALDALTRQHGTLFVVAAGNDGPNDHTVPAPGAAATALTVGAVDRDDRIAPFSSRGPQVNTYALKPELVAPGVDIVAARAAGTALDVPVDEHYVALSGTSMAAPHVAGAAALMAQRHPDWRAERLKSALIGGADPATGGDTYVVGAGRLNAARPLDGVVSDTGTVQLGVLPYPETGVSETAVSWTNTGDRRATLALSASLTDRQGRAAPVSLSVTYLRLEPGASGTATLRVDVADRPGLYHGAITGRVGDRVVARTPVTLYVEGRARMLTIGATPRAGTPAEQLFSVFTIVNLDDPAALTIPYVETRGTETIQVRVPEGRYSVMAWVSAFQLNPFRSVWDAIGGDPDVLVNDDVSVIVDVARGGRISGAVAGVPTGELVTAFFFEQRGRRGEPWSNAVYSFNDIEFLTTELYAVPTDGVGIGEFSAYEAFSLIRPGPEPSPYAYDLLRSLGSRIPADLAYVVTPAEHARLARIEHRFHRLDIEPTGTFFKRYGLSKSGNLFGESQYNNVGTSRTDYVSPEAYWLDEAFYDGVVEDATVSQGPFRLYRPGSRTEYVWGRQPMRPDWYDDPIGTGSFCQPMPIRRTREVLNVELADFVDQHQRFDCLDDFFFSWAERTERRLALSFNGQQLGEVTGSRGLFAIPRDAGTYRLTYQLKTDLPISSRVDTAWTFRSKAPRGVEAVPVPLLSVDYTLPLDLANKPVGGEATFAVRQTVGLDARRITGFLAWASTDDGVTWTPVNVRRVGGDRFAAALPVPAAGQAVSLRVDVTADGGGRLEQTIIRAYRAS